MHSRSLERKIQKIDTRMYAWMHFVLQVAHIIEKGVSQFKRTERYSDYVYECNYNMDVDNGIWRNKTFWISIIYIFTSLEATKYFNGYHILFICQNLNKWIYFSVKTFPHGINLINYVWYCISSYAFLCFEFIQS